MNMWWLDQQGEGNALCYHFSDAHHKVMSAFIERVCTKQHAEMNKFSVILSTYNNATVVQWSPSFHTVPSFVGVHKVCDEWFIAWHSLPNYITWRVLHFLIFASQQFFRPLPHVIKMYGLSHQLETPFYPSCVTKFMNGRKSMVRSNYCHTYYTLFSVVITDYVYRNYSHAQLPYSRKILGAKKCGPTISL